jgi:hypothetical protein
MKSKFFASAFLFATSCNSAIYHEGFDPDGKELDVAIQTQEQTQWCWAATSQAILEWQDIHKSQCEIASETFNRDCCTDKMSCNGAYRIVSYNAIGLNLDVYEGPISADDIKEALTFDRYVVIYLAAKKGAHFVSITGYDKDGKFTVQNSAAENGAASFSVPWSDLLQDYPSFMLGGGWHWKATYIFHKI